MFSGNSSSSSGSSSVVVGSDDDDDGSGGVGATPPSPPPKPYKALISCVDLSCERSGRVLFGGVSFTLCEGGMLLLSGANGSGKTSLLRVIAGLLPSAYGDSEIRYYPRGSEIGVEGRRIKSPQDYDGDVVYIGHKNAVKPEATVLENIEFWAEVAGNPSLIPAAIEYWGLYPYIAMKCSQLSAGWKRRVALARLMTCPARLWLLDEPMSNLDDVGSRMFAGLVQSRVNGGGAVIMASHGIDSLPFKSENDTAAAFSVLHIADFAPIYKSSEETKQQRGDDDGDSDMSGRY